MALTLNIPRNFTHARLVPENVELNVVRTETGAQIKLPCIDGYAIVEAQLIWRLAAPIYSDQSKP